MNQTDRSGHEHPNLRDLGRAHGHPDPDPHVLSPEFCSHDSGEIVIHSDGVTRCSRCETEMVWVAKADLERLRATAQVDVLHQIVDRLLAGAEDGAAVWWLATVADRIEKGRDW